MWLNTTATAQQFNIETCGHGRQKTNKKDIARHRTRESTRERKKQENEKETEKKRQRKKNPPTTGSTRPLASQVV